MLRFERLSISNAGLIGDVAADHLRELPRRVTGRRLDLHDVGAPVGEDAAGRRAGDPHAELDRRGFLRAVPARRRTVHSVPAVRSSSTSWWCVPGNTCRSPMTEACCKRSSTPARVDARVHSAGTLPWSGRASEGARDAAMRSAASTSTRTAASGSSAELLDDADLVLGHDPQPRVERRRTTRPTPPIARSSWASWSASADRGRAAPCRRAAARRGRRGSAALRADPRVPGQPQDEVADPAGEPVDGLPRDRRPPRRRARPPRRPAVCVDQYDTQAGGRSAQLQRSPCRGRSAGANGGAFELGLGSRTMPRSSSRRW